MTGVVWLLVSDHGVAPPSDWCSVVWLLVSDHDVAPPSDWCGVDTDQ